MKDFLLTDADRAFRTELRDFLARELAPRPSAIENEDSWDDVKAVIRALGEAGYMSLIFADLYR
ncbi:MAG: acyl-CoA dehydrogenase family protein, partial [Vicinamibacterales bacterium]